MTIHWRPALAWLRRHVAHAFVALLVLLALGNGIGMLLLPLAERHPQRVAAWLSTRAGRPVAFDHVGTRWTSRGPLLRLDGLRVGDPADPVQIGSAEILIAQYTGLLPGRSFTEIRLRGLDLTLQRADNGQWQVRGLPGQRDGEDPLAALEHLGELQLARTRLRVLAPELGVDLRVPRVDVRLRVNGPRLRAGAQAWLQGDRAPVDVVVDFDRAVGDGRIFAGSPQADLRALSGAFAIAGVSPGAGSGQLRAWGVLRAHRIVGIRAVASLRDVVLQGRTTAGQAAARLRWSALELDADWTGTVNDWRLQVPRLRIQQDSGQWTLDGIAAAGGHHDALRARRLQARPLLELATLGDTVPAGIRRWLRTAAPDATLEDVDIRRGDAGWLRASARVHGFRFDPVGVQPGMRGVGGWLQVDQDGLRLRFDPEPTVEFDWPAGFGVLHAFHLDGEAVLWRDGEGWTVRTPGLAIDGGQLQARARGGISFREDGRLPHLDIAADIGDTPIALAHGFWIHHLMPKATVEWLDAALRGGSLRQVHAIVAGDLGDWPFRDAPGLAGAGRFQADARIDNGTVKFQPDWPAAERMDARVSFVANGFSVSGRAQLGGVQVTTLQAGIAHFDEAVLRVDADAAADASRYLAMLSASPLHKEYGEVIDNLHADGPARARFAMVLPLDDEATASTKVDGRVQLDGVRLRESRWDLDFSQVRGEARYDQDGFVANGLQVQHEGGPGMLALRAGPQVQDPKNAFEAQFQARADIVGLLDKAGDSLAWLTPYLRGSSIWTAAVAIPRAAAGSAAAGPASLRLRSDLVGTRLDLPQPLRKPPAQALPTEVTIRLPLENGEIDASLGNVLALRTRSRGAATGVRIQLGGRVSGEVPARGLLVAGKAGQLDALGWVGMVAAAPTAGPDFPLLGVNLEAGRLQLLGGEFPAATLRVAPAERELRVDIQATGLQGVLQLPERKDAAVTGHFTRLYWPTVTASATPNTVKANVPGAAAGARLDPAKIPPLALDVDDLRIGTTAFGRARFRSVPVARGLRLDEFATSGGKQRLKATGTWTGTGADERSAFKLDMDSDDIGALLGGLGLGGQVAGGRGRLGISADWNGGPDRFDLLRANAVLSLEAHDGRLLEVEPGAGRVLGLLGAAQLRRRLTLDFSDLFAKGFSFDRIQGDARLAAGRVTTDNMTVRAPSADLLIRGETDLRGQRFDQTVEVKPHSGSLLTAVGALAGGPLGAAVGAVAGTVLDKPMRGIGAKTYRITGPWSQPVIDVLPPRSAPRSGAQAGAASATAGD